MAAWGLISAEDCKALLQMLREWRSRIKSDRRAATDVSAGARQRFRIDSSTGVPSATASIGGVVQYIRWLYVLVLVRWNKTSQAWEDVPGAPVIEDALNTNEDSNSATALGPGYLVTNITAGFEYCAAGKAGGNVDILTVVAAAAEQDDDGEITWKFWHPNTLDGACP